jgi:hypothetical protein
MPRLFGMNCPAEGRRRARSAAPITITTSAPVAGGRFPAPLAGGRFPAPLAGGRFPAPVAGMRFPGPTAGGRFPVPVAGAKLPAPATRARQARSERRPLVARPVAGSNSDARVLSPPCLALGSGE